jgi:hypothetical protein
MVVVRARLGSRQPLPGPTFTDDLLIRAATPPTGRAEHSAQQPFRFSSNCWDFALLEMVSEHSARSNIAYVAVALANLLLYS